MSRSLLVSLLALAAAVAALLTGCGGTRAIEKEGRIIWPEPPDTARIAYVQTLKGEDDFSTGLAGALSAIAGKKGVVKFLRPFDICVADDGKLFVTDAVQGIILYDTKKREVLPIGEKVGEELKDPRGIGYGHGKVFVGIASIGQVLIIDNEGRGIGKIGTPKQFPNPVDVVADTMRSRVYIVDNRLHQVLAYSEKGDSLFTIGRRGAEDGEFNYPQSLALDKQGSIYVVDAFNYRVQVFDTTGKFMRKFGKQGDAYATFARPKGIALDSFGNIYVLDGIHNNFQIFNNASDFLLFVGHSSAKNDGFQNPVSMAIDGNNTIYVTDNLNGRIQVFQLLFGQRTE
ncbi:MAG TPA: 6-bladed beta-propeller [Bacteroidota bacterium]|jgi:hypothetical protein|nr:6-bladed beta-propeller [Bacteroidota bacterium]